MIAQGLRFEEGIRRTDQGSADIQSPLGRHIEHLGIPSA